MQHIVNAEKNLHTVMNTTYAKNKNQSTVAYHTNKHNNLNEYLHIAHACKHAAMNLRLTLQLLHNLFIAVFCRYGLSERLVGVAHFLQMAILFFNG